MGQAMLVNIQSMENQTTIIINMNCMHDIGLLGKQSVF
jgi:hypothetical protein